MAERTAARAQQFFTKKIAGIELSSHSAKQNTIVAAGTFHYFCSEKYQRSAIVTNSVRIVTRRPADIQFAQKWELLRKILLSNPGPELSSHSAKQNTIVAAGTFHYPVRNGMEWFHTATETGISKQNQKSIVYPPKLYAKEG